ncbi:MAG: hypothetical protein ABSE91_03315 [Patescibacteria group bacterium]|jgi:hypothetical protein
MNLIYHKGLTTKNWFSKNIFYQMANIGSEVGRANIWKKKNHQDSVLAFERALELLDLTIIDPKNKSKLKELLRLREVLADYFVFDNQYKSSEHLWNNYFNAFGYAARLKT